MYGHTFDSIDLLFVSGRSPQRCSARWQGRSKTPGNRPQCPAHDCDLSASRHTLQHQRLAGRRQTLSPWVSASVGVSLKSTISHTQSISAQAISRDSG